MFMTVDEAAQYLRLNSSTVYRLVRRGDLPGVKVGKQWRLHKEWLDEWFRDRSYSIAQPDSLVARDRTREASDAVNEDLRLDHTYPTSPLNRPQTFALLDNLTAALANWRRKRDPGLTSPSTTHLYGLPPRRLELAGVQVGGGQPVEVASRGGRTGSAGRGAPRWQRAALPIVGVIGLAGVVAGLAVALHSQSGPDSALIAVSSPASAGGRASEPTSSDLIRLGSASVHIPSSGGNPFTYLELETVWEAYGLAVTPSDPSDGFAGTTLTAVEVRLTRDSDSMLLTVLIYETPAAARKDWQLISGEAPVLKSDLGLPDNTPKWWNQNIVVVVRSVSGNIRADALKAFLSLDISGHEPSDPA